MLLEAQVAFIPKGKPEATPIPVAPEVIIVIGLNGVFIQPVEIDNGLPAVFVGKTRCAPDKAKTGDPHPAEFTAT